MKKVTKWQKKKERDEPEESGMTLSSVYHRLVVEPV